MTFMKRTAATAPAAGSGRSDSRLFIGISRNILRACNIYEPEKLIRGILSAGLTPKEMASLLGKTISGGAKPVDHAVGSVPIPTAVALQGLPELLSAGLKPPRILALYDGIIKTAGSHEGQACLIVLPAVVKSARHYLGAEKTNELFSRLVAEKIVNYNFFKLIPSALEAGLTINSIVSIGAFSRDRGHREYVCKSLTAFINIAPKKFNPGWIATITLGVYGYCGEAAGNAFASLAWNLDKIIGTHSDELAAIILAVLNTTKKDAGAALNVLPAVLEAGLNRQEIKGLFEVVGEKENQDEGTNGFESLPFAVRAARSVLSVNATISLLTNIAKEAKEMTPYAYEELPDLIKEGQGSEEIIRRVKDAREYYIKSEFQGSDDFLEILRPNREDRF